MRINSYKELCRELSIFLEIPEKHQNIRDCRMIIQRVKRLKSQSLVLPERRNTEATETILQWHKDVEWNACLDRVKELNS